MAVPLISTAFTTGEVSPSLFGRVDLAKFHSAAATLRNMYVSYKGGAYSRAGTMQVGFSKQTGRTVPPRVIPFQFNINQGLTLEFGNFYMRVISDGAYITENALAITGATQTNPCVVTGNAIGATAATPNNGAVVSSYAPADKITLAGGAFATPAVLAVTNTKLLGLQLNAPGGGYAPADTIHLSGGTQSSPAIVTVSTTQVAAAAVASAGTGGVAGPAVVMGTTGTGVKFQANVTINGGSGGIISVNSIALAGSYTVNPTTPTAEPVTGGGVTGATLNLTIGVGTFSITSVGVFTANPVGLTFSQGSTSGLGTGATFQFALMGPNALTVSTAGVYNTFPSNPVAQASTTGSGVGATFTLSSAGVPVFSNDDWVNISGVGGMTQLNGGTFVVSGVSGSNFNLNDVYGNPIDATSFSAYTSGGTAARIYTLITPWAEADLEYLKFTQSADVMSITCVNQKTLTEYLPQDLARISDSNWTLTAFSAAPSVLPPASTSGVASAPGGTGVTAYVDYQYVVTAVSPIDGSESVASPIADIPNAVDISSTVGTITITWSAVPNVNEYNIYKAKPAIANAAPLISVPAGSLFGYAGSAYGTQFIDTNIVSDFTQVPPTHLNPFSRGKIIAVNPVAGGINYTTIGYTITTSTGSGAVLVPILVSGSLAAVIIVDSGQNYAATDTIAITGNGTGATALLTIGAQTGTYPGVVAYFQQRRVYASSLNNPDTYFMSQPGAYKNFDIRIPTIASDAIIGSPWANQVNGIQFMVPMPGGLVALTGLAAWQLTGAGGSSLNPQSITPSSQQAQPQAYNGCSATVPPIKIDYDIVYVQAKGSIYRDLSYQFYTNIYTGTDLTQYSSQLFTGYTIREHAWCEEPYKVLWSVRSDGILLSMTYNKPQEVTAWARHDTNGLFQSVCSVTEPPVDALYLVVQRNIGTNTAYMVERMDNRIWDSVENCWCVDCGLALAQPQPNATLNANSATGLGAITGVTNLVGGSNYSAQTTAFVVDDNGNGPGTGAVPALTIVGGIIIAVSFAGNNGINYTIPKLVIVDPSNTGSGASAQLVLDNSAIFKASIAVFSAPNVGSVIRMGGGIATITSFTDSTHVVANITSPIVAIQPNSVTVAQPQGLVQAQAAGTWSMTAPVTTISGLQHLAGATVTGLADGNIVPPTVVSAAGTITLATPASAVIIGLSFQAQMQSIYLDAGNPTVQGQRKKVAMVTARIESSRGLKMGSNQLDGSTVTPLQIAPKWKNLSVVPDKGVPPYNSNVIPLFTGDVRIPVTGGYNTKGQVCLQQDNPLPMQILALIEEVLPGDQPETEAKPKQRAGGQR